MDPYEAAQLAAEKCDGTLFMERRIRVDLVNKKGLRSDAKATVNQGVTDTDPKLSVFVGNLDFASKEEDLRVFFEGVVSTERGPPEVDSDEEDDDAVKKLNSWVTRVRIVRDKETQLGKGFAYVQFAVSDVLKPLHKDLQLMHARFRIVNVSMKCWLWMKSNSSSQNANSVFNDAKRYPVLLCQLGRSPPMPNPTSLLSNQLRCPSLFPKATLYLVKNWPIWRRTLANSINRQTLIVWRGAWRRKRHELRWGMAA